MENTRDIELRVIRRPLEAACAPAYHASTTVCSSPYASTATSRPTTVSAVRNLWRSAFLKISLNTCMRAPPGLANSCLPDQLALFQLDPPPGRLRRLRVVRHHEHRLAQLP